VRPHLHPPPPRPAPTAASFSPVQGRVGDFRPRKVGIPRYDLRDPYYTAVTAPWSLFLLTVLALVLLVNLAFAALYLAEPGAVQNLAPGHFADAFFFSVETLSTVGYGAMAPASFYGHLVATAEIIAGLGFTASLTGILFVRLSKPRARILFADQLAVTEEEDGRTVLSIRVANGRRMLLNNASAVLSAVTLRQDETGAAVWEAHRLALEQDQVSLFPLTWTLRHPMLEPSPLASLHADRPPPDDMRLYLMITAHDPAINAEVQAIREYSCGALNFGKRYADAISRGKDGRLVADLSRLGILLDRESSP
jgi:inward rectifier potassium channel